MSKNLLVNIGIDSDICRHIVTYPFAAVTTFTMSQVSNRDDIVCKDDMRESHASFMTDVEDSPAQVHLLSHSSKGCIYDLPSLL